MLWRRPSTAASLVSELRALHAVWPRAESKLYEEPRKLVAHGLATARTKPGGRRPRATYTITDAGRAAFVGWLAQPAQPVALESEALLKACLADTGDPELLLERIDDLASWSRHQLDERRAALRQLARHSPRERAALDAVITRLLADLAATVDRWAAWAAAEVAGWESVAGAPLPEGMRTEPPYDESAAPAP